MKKIIIKYVRFTKEQTERINARLAKEIDWNSVSWQCGTLVKKGQ